MLLYFERMRSDGKLNAITREGSIFGILCKRRRHTLFTKISGSSWMTGGETNVSEKYRNAQISWEVFCVVVRSHELGRVLGLVVVSFEVSSAKVDTSFQLC